jgi:H+/gluconate symporter-like permease
MLPSVLLNTVKTIAMVFSLIAAAGAFGWMLAFLRVPTIITDFVLSISDNSLPHPAVHEHPAALLRLHHGYGAADRYHDAHPAARSSGLRYGSGTVRRGI